MPRIRLTVDKHPLDRADDLRLASRLRASLYTHSAIAVDPDNRAYAIHRDGDGNAYFEFSADSVQAVQDVVSKCGVPDRVKIAKVAGPDGEPCLNCGNIAGAIAPAVCTNCGFRDVSDCPHCGEHVPRKCYKPFSGNLLRCPSCNGFVRLAFNDPLFKPNGEYNQPVVIVHKAVEQAQ